MKCSKHPSNPPGDLLTTWVRSSHIAAHLGWICFWAGGGANDNNAPTQHLLWSSTLSYAAWPINLYIATGCMCRAKKKKPFCTRWPVQMCCNRNGGLISIWSSSHVILMVYFFTSPFTSFIHVSVISAHDLSKKLGGRWERSIKQQINGRCCSFFP